MQRGMLRGLAAFRWGTWIWMAVVVFLHRDQLDRPLLVWVLVGAALAWTLAATILLDAIPRPRIRPAIAYELVIAAAIGLGAGVATCTPRAASEAFASFRTVGFAWPIAGVITAGVVYGPTFGRSAGSRSQSRAFFAPVANGVAIADFGGHWSRSSRRRCSTRSRAPSAVTWRAVAPGGGQVAAARAREGSRARCTTACCRRWPSSNGAPTTRNSPISPASKSASCASSSSAATARSPPISAPGCARSAARDSRTHSAAASRSSSPTTFRRSMPQRRSAGRRRRRGADQRGQARARAAGDGLRRTRRRSGGGLLGTRRRPRVRRRPRREGVGLSRSIRGRMEEAGGRVEIDSRPGAGTEVRLWLPCG